MFGGRWAITTETKVEKMSCSLVDHPSSQFSGSWSHGKNLVKISPQAEKTRFWTRVFYDIYNIYIYIYIYDIMAYKWGVGVILTTENKCGPSSKYVCKYCG